MNCAICRAFNSQYWPALYFIDVRGRVRDRHFGEGEYQRSETAIQRLLAEAGVAGVRDDLVLVVGESVEAAVDWDNLKSPETYVGYDRTQNFASRGGADLDRPPSPMEARSILFEAGSTDRGRQCRSHFIF